MSPKTSEQDLLRALCSIQQPAQMKKLLEDVLTPAEYAAICKRWRIFQLLEQGFSQREVARAIGGSLCSVTRGARIMRSGHSLAINLVREK